MRGRREGVRGNVGEKWCGVQIYEDASSHVEQQHGSIGLQHRRDVRATCNDNVADDWATQQHACVPVDGGALRWRVRLNEADYGVSPYPSDKTN